MAAYTSGAHSLSMTAIDFTDLSGGTITANSTTEIDVTGASGTVYKIVGTGFTTFDANGFPTDGTVTGFDIAHGGGAAAAFTGLSMGASTFMGFVDGDDLAGFETSALSGDDHIKGYKGNDVLVGEAGNDLFNLGGGGNDTVSGGDGADKFSFAGTFTAADTVDGGTGNDRVLLDGDYSAGITLGATTLTGVEYIVLTNGHSYNITTNDANVASGASLTIQGQTLNASSMLIFDGSAETDGSFHVDGGKGDDRLIGGAGNDTLSAGDGNNVIDISRGGNDIAAGGSGNDMFDVGAALTRSDKIDGGSGDDTIVFDGNYAAATTFDIRQFSHIDHAVFAAGHDYDIRLNLTDTNNALHTLQSVDASALGAGNSLTFSADGGLNPGSLCTVTGGAGDDTVDVQSGWQVTVDNTEGGDDTVIGSDQGQTDVLFGATLTAGDVVHGSHFTDISLAGDYSAGLVLSASHLKDISQIYLQSDFDYNLTFQGNVGSSANGIEIDSLGTATGHSVTIDASALTTHTNFELSTFNSFHLVGNNAGDAYVVTSTAASSLVAGSGTDNITWIGFASGDTVDGGGGADVLGLTYNGTLSSSMIQNIADLSLTNSTVTLADNLIAAGQQMAVSEFGNGTIDGSAETDGTIAFTANGGSTATPITLIGGAGDDTVDQALGALSFTGGGGADTITLSPFFPASATVVYHAASESTGVNFDTITFFSASRDLFDMPKAVTGIDATVTSGALTTANFDSDLATAVNAAHLTAHHAVEFTPTSGDYNDDTFLIVDLNGTAGYQAGHDIVIEINTDGALSTSNFV